MPSDSNTRAATSRVPRATYRLQFHQGMTLSHARELVPYLHQLGISHLYASPLLKASPGSKHGYDTCDFDQLDPELGTEAGLASLVETLRQHGMGLVLDIVPNHMSVTGPENRWWWDVLTRGRESPFARHFDIDWARCDPRVRGKVLLPVLNDRYDQVLQNRGLQLNFRDNEWVLRHGETEFPVNAASMKSVAGVLEEVNSSPEALDAIVSQQFYRLTWMQHGDHDVNYRRFFNVIGLAGLRVEDERVFQQVMARVRHWLERGWLDGVRVDHPDGLRDPEQFLRRVRALAPNAWVVVEKILQEGESLPASWPVAGTTGYDFLNCAGGLFVDPDGEKPLGELYAEFTGDNPNYAALEREKKRQAMRTSLAADTESLIDLLARIAAKSWRSRDFTRAELGEAMTELAAFFPVYRNYVCTGNVPVAMSGVTHVANAVREARRERPDLPAGLFLLLADVLLLRQRGEEEDEFVARFQQWSGPVMAKGAEDAAFYCYNRLVALNEVGGNPGCFGGSVEAFHNFCRRRQEEQPTGMLATSTHDTKRSEDVRARLYLLSEIPSAWGKAVRRWSKMNENHRVNGWPDRNAEYFFYQTLAGAWPLSLPRALACAAKAAREAGEHTRWIGGNPEYDSALSRFVIATLADKEFQADLESFVVPLIKPGCVNSLAITLLKLAAPGVPDFYQGNELWDLSLMDPDNRRPVDFELRKKVLTKAAGMTAEQAWQEWESGLPKLWLIRQMLELRRRRPDCFAAEAAYQSMAASGHAKGHVIAFRRGEDLIAVAPRLALKLGGEWGDTSLALPEGSWRNELTCEELPKGNVLLTELLRKFPVALLLRKEKV